MKLNLDTIFWISNLLKNSIFWKDKLVEGHAKSTGDFENQSH